jgi:hypothetical protein
MRQTERFGMRMQTRKKDKLTRNRQADIKVERQRGLFGDESAILK